MINNAGRKEEECPFVQSNGDRRKWANPRPKIMRMVSRSIPPDLGLGTWNSRTGHRTLPRHTGTHIGVSPCDNNGGGSEHSTRPMFATIVVCAANTPGCQVHELPNIGGGRDTLSVAPLRSIQGFHAQIPRPRSTPRQGVDPGSLTQRTTTSDACPANPWSNDGPC